MATGIGEIGTLVGIVKALFDIAKTGIDIRGKREKKATATIEQLKARILQLHDQIESCAMLERHVPDWITQSRTFNISLDALSDDEVQTLRGELEHFLSRTRNDSFSNAFFAARQKTVPGITEPLHLFNTAFTALTAELRHPLAASSVKNLREHWSSMQTRFSDMQNQAEHITQEASKTLGELLLELKSAASVPAPRDA